MAKEQNVKEKRRGRIVRLVSYILSLMFGGLTYVGLLTTLGKQPALIVGTIVFLVALSALSNFKQALEMLLDDIPGILRKAWHAIKRVITEPRLHPLEEAMHACFSTWWMSLLQPVRFAFVEYQQMVHNGVRGLMPIAASLALFLSVNSFLSWLVLGRFAYGANTLWSRLLWSGVVPMVPIALEPWISPKKRQTLRTLRWSPWLFWFWLFLVGAWVWDIFSCTATSEGQLNGISMLTRSLVVSLAIGTLFGFLGFISSRPPKLIRFSLALCAGLIAAGKYSLVPQPREFLTQAEGDPVVAPLYLLYEELGSHTQYGDVPIPRPYEETPQTDLLMSLPLATGTLAFIGGLLEAPVFYVSLLLLLMGSRYPGLRLLKLVVHLDEWRVNSWYGEAQCYAKIGVSAPAQFVSLVGPQVLYTARRPWALNSLASFVISVEPRVALEALIALLPYAQYECLVPEFYPRVSLLASADRDSTFNTLYSHRRTIFRDILDDLSTRKASSSYTPLLTHGPMLNALDAIAQATWGSVRDGLAQASAIKRGLRDYQEVLHAKGIYLLADAVERSLLVVDVEQIGLTAAAWQAFIDGSRKDEILATCIDRAQDLLTLAQIMREVENSDQTALAQAALHYIDIQNQFTRDRTHAQALLGLQEFCLIANRWGELLHAAIRQYRQSATS